MKGEVLDRLLFFIIGDNMKFRIKHSIEEYFNKNIQIYNDILELQQDIEEEKVDMDEIVHRLNSLNFGAVGIEEEVLAGYLKDIAKRAIELNDEKLLEYCEGLKIVEKG